MGLINQIFNRWKLRTHCSCGSPAKQIDDRIFECPMGCGCYDGAEEFIQQKVLIREKDTVFRTL